MNDRQLAFDGATTTVDLGSVESLGLGADFTVELYVLLDAEPSPGPILSIGVEGDSTQGASIELSLGEDQSLRAQVAGAEPIGGVPIAKVGSRSHLALSYDAGADRLSLYLNGEDYHSAVSSPGFRPDPSARVLLGTDRQRAAYFSGGISEVRVFDGLRDQARVRQDLFRRLSGVEDHLRAYFPLDGLEGDSDTAARDAKLELDPLSLEPLESARPPASIRGGTWLASDLPLHRAPRADESSPAVVVGAFDGLASHIVVPSSDSLTLDTLTVEAWVRPTGRGRPHHTYPIVSKHAVKQGWELRAGNGKGGFIVAIDNAYHELTVPLQDDVWQLLSASYDGANLRFYVNGVLRDQRPAPGPLTPCPEDMNIGRNPYWRMHCFEGEIAEVRVFEGARDPYFFLSQSRPVWADANVIAAHYHFDGSAEDQSPSSSNHGTDKGVQWVSSDPPLPPSSEAARTAISLDLWDKNVRLRLEQARLTKAHAAAMSSRTAAEQDLGEAQKSANERAQRRQALEQAVAELEALPAKIAELDATIAARQEEIQQIKAERGEISVADFTQKLHSEFRRAREQLSSSGMGGVLTRMNFEVKAVPGTSGTTLMFPTFEAVQAMGSDKMSSLDIGFEVSKGPKTRPSMAQVPDLIGSTEALAKRMLDHQSLVAEVAYQATEPSAQGTFPEAGRVRTQLPAAGSEVPTGSKVMILIGREAPC